MPLPKKIILNVLYTRVLKNYYAARSDILVQKPMLLKIYNLGMNIVSYLMHKCF